MGECAIKSAKFPEVTPAPAQSLSAAGFFVTADRWRWSRRQRVANGDAKAPDSALITVGGVRLTWVLVPLLFGGMFLLGVWVKEGETRQLELMKWQNERPTMREMVLLLDMVERHDQLLTAPRWSADQELSYQTQHRAEHSHSDTEMLQLRDELQQDRANTSAITSQILDQINELYLLDKRLQQEQTDQLARIRRLERIQQIDAQAPGQPEKQKPR